MVSPCTSRDLVSNVQISQISVFLGHWSSIIAQNHHPVVIFLHQTNSFHEYLLRETFLMWFPLRTSRDLGLNVQISQISVFLGGFEQLSSPNDHPVVSFLHQPNSFHEYLLLETFLTWFPLRTSHNPVLKPQYLEKSTNLKGF